MRFEENNELNNEETAVLTEEKRQFSPSEMAIIDEMIEAGVLHGRKHSKTNPKMTKYILSTRRGIEIFDLLQTKELLEKTIAFLKEIKDKKQQVLVVCTKFAARDLAENFAKKFDFPYVNERWLGGTLTNFKTVTKRVEYLKKLRADKEAGLLSKYTKKEQLMMERSLKKLEKLFGGIENLDQLPAALLIIDVTDHQTAVREANQLGIPIIGLINTDGDPDLIQYPIPSNDNARSSIIWILEKMEETLLVPGEKTEEIKKGEI